MDRKLFSADHYNSLIAVMRCLETEEKVNLGLDNMYHEVRKIMVSAFGPDTRLWGRTASEIIAIQAASAGETSV